MNRYYSAHSVCIPRLYVTKSNPSWPLSIALSIINLLSFLTVAVGYLMIFRKANATVLDRKRSDRLRNDKNKKETNKKKL